MEVKGIPSFCWKSVLFVTPWFMDSSVKGFKSKMLTRDPSAIVILRFEGLQVETEGSYGTSIIKNSTAVAGR